MADDPKDAPPPLANDAPWVGPPTGESILTDVLEMVALCHAQQRYGPTVVYDAEGRHVKRADGTWETTPWGDG